MAPILVGDYDASTFVEGDYATYPQPPGVPGGVTTRNSYALSPGANLLSSFSFNSAGPGSLVAGWGAYSSAARSTRTATSATRLGAKAALPLGVPVAVRIHVRASEVLASVQVILRPDLGTNNGQVILGTVTIPAGVSVINLTGVTPVVAATGAGQGLALVWSSGAINSTLDMTGIQIEDGAAVGAYFDGSTPDTGDTDYAWTGAVDASPSTATTTPVMLYQLGMAWHVTVAGIVQGQNANVNDLLFATPRPRQYGDYTYGGKLYGQRSVESEDWEVDELFFLVWDGNAAPPDQIPYPNAGCPFTPDHGYGGQWAPGWRVVIDCFYDDIADARRYGTELYGDRAYGDDFVPTATNLMVKPSFEDASVADFAGVGCTLAPYTWGTAANPNAGVKGVRITATQAATCNFGAANAVKPAAIPGRRYRISAYVRQVSGAATARLDVSYRDAANGLLGAVAYGPTVTMINGWLRVEATLDTAPANTAMISVTMVHPSGVAIGNTFDWDAIMVHEIAAVGDPTLDYFDGDTPDTGDYVYAWTGTPKASTSTRQTIVPIVPPHWVDITQPAFHIETGDGMADGGPRVVVSEVVVSFLDPIGRWFDMAPPQTYFQPQPGTPIRIGMLDPFYRYHPIITAEIERIEDTHNADGAREVFVRGFGKITDLVVDIPNVLRPAELASTRFNWLAQQAGWSWDTKALVFPPGDATLLADKEPRVVVARDEMDRTCWSVGWFLDSDKKGRMRVRTWPNQPEGETLHVADCHGQLVQGGPTVEVARNLFTRPSFEDNLITGLGVSGASLGVVGTTTSAAIPGVTGVKALRTTVTTAGALTNVWISSTIFPRAEPGKLYRYSAYTRSGEAVSTTTAQLFAEYRDSNNVITGGQVSSPVITQKPNNGWTRMEVTLPAAPETATGIMLYLRQSGGGTTGPVPVGIRTDWDAMMVHEVSSATDPTLPYFDGDTQPTPGLLYHWEGARWASVSVKRAQGSTPMLVSHSIAFANDESQLLNYVLTTNTADPDPLTVLAVDEVSVTRFHRRGRAHNFPMTGLAWSDAATAQVWANRVLDRYSAITRQVESFEVDTAVDQGWLKTLIDLDTGRGVRINRTTLTPMSMDGVIVGWRWRLDPGRWQGQAFVATTTESF